MKVIPIDGNRNSLFTGWYVSVASKPKYASDPTLYSDCIVYITVHPDGKITEQSQSGERVLPSGNYSQQHLYPVDPNEFKERLIRQSIEKLNIIRFVCNQQRDLEQRAQEPEVESFTGRINPDGAGVIMDNNEVYTGLPSVPKLKRARDSEEVFTEPRPGTVANNRQLTTGPEDDSID